MMNYPPIDELVAKVGNVYVLCNLITKRAKQIATVRRAELAGSDKKKSASLVKKSIKAKWCQATFN